MLNSSWMSNLWQRISQWFKPKTSIETSYAPSPAPNPSTSTLPTVVNATINSTANTTVPNVVPVLEPAITTPNLMPVTHTIDTQVLPTLRATVRIRQGNLLQSQYPVMVGHYQQDVISGAEQVLDNALKGQLRQWQHLGIYAGTVGTSTLVIDLSLQPKGALVLGLGTAGQLYPNKLVTSYARALLRYTRHPEALCNAQGAWQLSTLLIGAQAPTLTLQQVVESLLLGIRAASERLQEQQLPYQFDIEIIELDAWRALEASDILFELVQKVEYSTEFILTEYLQQLPSTSPVVKPKANNQGWWSRWDLTSTTLPRIPNDTEREAPTVDLLPTSARAQWLNGSSVIVQVDEGTYRTRWELLKDAITQQLPLGLQVAVVRQWGSTKQSESERVGSANGLLAIGMNDTPAWREVLPDMPQDWLLMDETERIFCALHTGNYSVLHWYARLAGTTKKPYLVLANDQFFTLSDITQLRNAPPLIILELQNSTAELNELLPKFIPTWLQTGTQTLLINTQTLNAQVSALWLRSFYQGLANGDEVGNAIFAARQKVWQAAGQQGTDWVGFEGYGDPSTRVTKAVSLLP